MSNTHDTFISDLIADFNVRPGESIPNKALLSRSANKFINGDELGKILDTAVKQGLLVERDDWYFVA